MGVFPKNDQMKIGMYFLSTIGVWRLNLKDHPKLDKLYKLYANLMYYYFVTFVIRQFIELFRLIFIGNVTRMMQNCSLTLLCFISAVRVAMVRGKTMEKITDFIIRAEDMVYASDEQELKKIYDVSVWMSQMASKFFIVVGTITATPFYFGPWAEAHAYPDRYQPDNITGKIHYRLPLSAYVPYDYSKHYTISFLWQVADGWTAECFVVYTDAFLFGLMIFPVGQLKMIQHIFRNFKTFVKKMQRFNPEMSYEEAAMATMKACAVYHKEMIGYVELLDTAMRWLMLLDFASCSIQMAVLVFQVIMSDINIPMIFALIFLISMVIQLFLFYWNANEITVESREIALAIYQGDWYEEPQEVLQCLQIMMVRAQKPLTVSIGPFYPMSTTTALSILKATYSYAMLIRQSYLRRQ